MPFRNIWLLPNAFKMVIVFASLQFAFSLRYIQAIRLLRPLYRVYSVFVRLQSRWFRTICLHRYRHFVRQPHRHITRLQKGNSSSSLSTWSCSDWSRTFTFFRKPPNLPSWHTFTKWFDLAHLLQEAPYARHLHGGAFYHSTGNVFGTVGTCLVPHPFAGAYS